MLATALTAAVTLTADSLVHFAMQGFHWSSYVLYCWHWPSQYKALSSPPGAHLPSSTTLAMDCMRARVSDTRQRARGFGLDYTKATGTVSTSEHYEPSKLA